MAVDHFRVDAPAIVRFSGGRTSAFMLHRIIQAYGGTLPDDVHVVFNNTGKERPETLDFVRECGDRWGVHVRWIEWRRGRPIEREHRGAYGPCCREVSHATASRNGEPFDELIRWKGFLPNPATKTCTQNLKMWSTWHFAIHVLGLSEWTSVVGIRYDEPRRWGIIGPDKSQRRATNVAPLVDAKVTEADVMAFWQSQPFDLRLRQHEGNCDLCFMKAAPTIDRILRDRPDLAEWWIRWENAGIAERATGNMWHDKRPTFGQMLDRARRLPILPGLDLDYDGRPCDCTD